MPIALTLSLIVGSLGVSTTPTIEPPLPIEVPHPIVELQKAVAAQIVPTPSKIEVNALISKVASEYGISSSSLYNLVQSESRLDPDAVGDHGRAFGLTQINLDYWPDVTRESALDPEFNLAFAAEKIKEDKGYLWTSGNCYSLVKTKIPNLPKMAQIVPNSEARIGAVAIFYYTDKQTRQSVKHIAYVQSVSGTGKITVFEANKEAFVISTREVSLDDNHLVGFWYPQV